MKPTIQAPVPIEAALEPFRQQASDESSGFGGAAGAGDLSGLDRPPHRDRVRKCQRQQKTARGGQAKQSENLDGRCVDVVRT